MQDNTRHLLFGPKSCSIGMYQRREANLGDTLLVPLQSLLVFVFGGPCGAIKSYNFRTSGHHQGMVVVENNPVVGFRLK